MARKRDRIDIISDMLSSISRKGGEIKPTHLMYKSNLAYNQMKSYLEELVEKNFVEKIKRKNNEYIIITDSGLKFLQKIKEMKEFEEQNCIGAVRKEWNDPFNEENRYVIYRQLAELTLECDAKLHCNLDGEPVRKRRLKFSVLPGHLRLVMS